MILLSACVASALLYRMGGSSKFNTKFRDLGCPTVLLALVYLMFGFAGAWWLYLLTFLLSFGALTTYLDNWYGYDNFWAHGFFCGLAGFPLFWCGVPPDLILWRIVISTIGMGLWSKFVGNDIAEECGRGVFFIL